jgi:hypothetical protein
LVVDAVLVEPVSTENSLLTGKLTGNFVRLPARGAILIADIRMNSAACSKIPYLAEQGIFAKEQGICTREQGI